MPEPDASARMRFAVESWAPEYGSSTDDALLDESDVKVDESVEVPLDQWQPIAARGDEVVPDSLLFIDGVRRVEAIVWVTAPDGETYQGLCASYAAGAVRCDRTATVVATEVRRGLFCPADGASDIETRHGVFALNASADDDPTRLSLLLQQRMGELEAMVAALAGRSASGAPESIIVDGPLKFGQDRPGFVGFVKTHRRSYGDKVVRQVVARLDCAERTPLLLVDAHHPRFTWYQRLPCVINHGWAGVVRLETTADQPVADVVRLADQLTASLPRYASLPQKDPRAPQNLVPIGGLERDLRHRLGDPQLLLRALKESAQHPPPLGGSTGP